MDITFLDLIDTLPKVEHFNECFYNLVELSKKIEAVSSISISMSDHHIILPFYIYQERTYEIYWYEFTLKSVAFTSFDTHVLEKLGKKKEDVDDMTIIERMGNLYLEVVEPETSVPSLKMIDCINYIKTSDEIIKDVTDVFRRYDESFEFDERNLYFVLY